MAILAEDLITIREMHEVDQFYEFQWPGVISGNQNCTRGFDLIIIFFLGGGHGGWGMWLSWAYSHRGLVSN